MREAKLPKVRLHDLRHSSASLLLAGGADLKTVSTALGHSTIAVTADTYARVSAAMLKDAATLRSHGCYRPKGKRRIAANCTDSSELLRVKPRLWRERVGGSPTVPATTLWLSIVPDNTAVLRIRLRRPMKSRAAFGRFCVVTSVVSPPSR